MRHARLSRTAGAVAAGAAALMTIAAGWPAHAPATPAGLPWQAIAPAANAIAGGPAGTVRHVLVDPGTGAVIWAGLSAPPAGKYVLIAPATGAVERSGTFCRTAVPALPVWAPARACAHS